MIHIPMNLSSGVVRIYMYIMGRQNVFLFKNQIIDMEMSFLSRRYVINEL